MTTPVVGVVDYSVGNIGSVVNMFRWIGADVRVVSTFEDVSRLDRLLLPGVGAFDHGMKMLREAGLDLALQERAKADLPTLGICLGMQLLLDNSEEGSEKGLGLISGASERFRVSAGSRLKVPHMGWTRADPVQSHPLLAGLETENRYYFVHSYFVTPTTPSDVIAVSEHGRVFCSVVGRGNILGTQFHPEKSHRYGMRVLSNFLAL